MKRYLIFAFDKYYPDGGKNDFKFDVDTEEEVEERIGSLLHYHYDYIQVLDRVEGVWMEKYFKDNWKDS